MRAGMVRLLGWLAIAHGLSHAVLPLRGSLEPAVAIDDWIPAGLYAIAMVGFVAAGLGMLGLRPLDRAISPLLVLASGLSLIAIVRFADPTLWFGAVGDVVFLGLGLWRAYGGWATRRVHGRFWHTAGVTVGFGLLLYVATASFMYPYHRTWGSTREELAMPLPGDPPQRAPGLEVQHAVTIDAPPQDVWPWLVQIGHDRAGFYDEGWLERAFSSDARRAYEVRPEWQSRQIGEIVPASQPGSFGSLFGGSSGWRITALEPEYTLVLENWGAFVLLPTEDGKTRFIIRSRIGSRDIPVWTSALNFLTFQMPHFVKKRRMMLTIKSLAEERWRARRAAAQTPPAGG